MTLGWQDFVAVGLVFVSAAYLIRQIRRATARKPAGGCASGGCGACPIKPGAGANPRLTVLQPRGRG